MARPTELTPETQQILCSALERLPIKLACQVAKIDRETYRRWMKRGETGEQPYADFAALARKSAADYAADRLAKIHEAAEDDWKAAAWYLERRFPGEFQPRSKTETKHSGRIDGNTGPDLSKLSTDELRAYHDIMAKLSDEGTPEGEG
jgi:hypothetical protein